METKMNNYHKFMVVIRLIREKGSKNNPFSTSQIKEILKKEYNTTMCSRAIESVVTSFNEIQDDYKIEIIHSNNLRFYFKDVDEFETTTPEEVEILLKYRQITPTGRLGIKTLLDSILTIEGKN